MKRLRHTLHDYVAGDLDEAACKVIEKRIATEPRVRKLHAEIAAAHEALLSLRDRPAPPVSVDNALPRIQAAISTDQYRERPKLYLEGSGTRFYRRVAMAATLLLAVSVTLMVVGRDGGEPVAPADGPEFGATGVPPSAVERGLVPAALVEAGEKGGLDGDELIEILEKAGHPDLRFTPNRGVLPVADGATERR